MTLGQKQRKTTPMIKEQLMRDEGLRLKPYKCPADKWTIGGYPIGYDALVMLDKTNWGYGTVTNVGSAQVENSLMVLTVEEKNYELGNRIFIPNEGGVQAGNVISSFRGAGSSHANYARMEAWVPGASGDQGYAGIHAICVWDAVTKEVISREAYVSGEVFIWRSDDNDTLDSTMTRLVQTIPATSTSPGKIGQFAADADYLYCCYAADSWIRIPKDNAW